MEENKKIEFKDVKRKMIFAYTGAFIGFILIKALVFNAMEDMGWAFFWGAIFEGNVNFGGLMEIVTTSGFIKLVVGTVSGFKIGEWLENGTIKQFIDDIKSDDEKENK